MQGLRPPREWDDDGTESEGGNGSARRDLARFLDEASDGEPLIDLLVVDEAHHLRNPETLLNHFGKLANSVASHRLFLSATPIHLRNRDLHSLLAMVDPDTFEFESTLNDLIETNSPIIAARDLLLRADASIAEILALLARRLAALLFLGPGHGECTWLLMLQAVADRRIERRHQVQPLASASFGRSPALHPPASGAALAPSRS
jgi:SNF2-related domain